MSTAIASIQRVFGSSVRLAIVLAIFVAGVLLGIGATQTFATHDGNIHACVHTYTGQSKIKLPGQPPNCNPNEDLVEWPSSSLTADLTALQAQVDALETQLLALNAQVPDCLSEAAGDALFTGCNVQIINGDPGNSTASTNGTGNLIVGYNENANGFFRNGSHNIVVGENHGYTSYGGLVVGSTNQINDAFASVSGGTINEASGISSSVSGGLGNTASGDYSSVSGGTDNLASALDSAVSGGQSNTASGLSSSVSGGTNNEAGNNAASVSGGQSNGANGIASTVSGGRSNVAGGNSSTVSGGTGFVAGNPDEHLP